MRLVELEGWVLSIVDLVRAGRHVEDDRIELKSEWQTDHWKAALRIAGHANAARGERVLWIIGLCEERGVVTAQEDDLAEWWPQVCRWFDGGIHPELQHISVPVDGAGMVVALLFDSSRAPFVIKKQGGQGFDRAVPWREGTRVRPAMRSDLIKLLVPQARKPVFDVLNARCDASIYSEEREGYSGPVEHISLRLLFDVYITPQSRELLTIPFHLIDFDLSSGGQPYDWHATEAIIRVRTKRPVIVRSTSALSSGPPPETDSHTIDATSTEALVSGPGFFLLRLDATMEYPAPLMIDRLEGHDLDVGVRLSCLPGETVSTLQASFRVEPGTRSDNQISAVTPPEFTYMRGAST